MISPPAICRTKTASGPAQRLGHLLPRRTRVADGLDPWAGVPVETESMAKCGSLATREILFSRSDASSSVYISQIMTLEPGDLIATGTPKGVGPVSRLAMPSKFQ